MLVFPCCWFLGKGLLDSASGLTIEGPRRPLEIYLTAPLLAVVVLVMDDVCQMHATKQFPVPWPPCIHSNRAFNGAFTAQLNFAQAHFNFSSSVLTLHSVSQSSVCDVFRRQPLMSYGESLQNKRNNSGFQFAAPTVRLDSVLGQRLASGV